MCVAEADTAQNGIVGQHPAHGKKKESGVDEGNDNGDLEEIEEYLGLDPRAAVRLREEEQHQDRGTIEAVEEAPGGIRQDFFVEQRVEGLQGCRNQQNYQDGGEQKPEQGSHALCATEPNPGASEGEKAIKNEDGLRKAEACLAGSEQKEAQRLGGDKGGEEEAHEPRLAEIHELVQARSARQTEIGRGSHLAFGETLQPSRG